MEIAFHIGAHCTDDDRLLKTLHRNAEALAAQGVSVPAPAQYRILLRDLATGLRGDAATHEAEEALLEAILGGADLGRLVLSNDSFLSAPARAVGEGRLYPRAHKAAWLRNAVPSCDVSFHLAMRDPAGFVPAVFARQGGRPEEFRAYIEGTDPMHLRWSDMVAQLREAVPDCPITVWQNEESPLIWTDILRDMAGLGTDAPLQGGFDGIRPIMSQEGMKKLRAYTRAHPPATEAMRRRVVVAFLDKFALDEEVEAEFDLPGWTEELTDALSEAYEADMARVAEIPGVTFLTR
ncbi:hypothetical protein EKE94_01060 [Mesobaculum littorinae]|uniref:Sulfotransferase family protein n=1 Tax=Mesobaculum littorinae TaxID=2486419 RepID=A0A438AL60_9RHOB|nr:hypothetical protein [Mesobaculum littorinae]RVV99317.1 hypothetical protein EKE94_01060 [Mesobaculum littorinae]